MNGVPVCAVVVCTASSQLPLLLVLVVNVRGICPIAELEATALEVAVTDWEGGCEPPS